MKSRSIGTQAPSSLLHRSSQGVAPAFTLIEALVALTLILAFSAATGPVLFGARRIVANAEKRTAAHVLLHSLIDTPVDRAHAQATISEGGGAGLTWQVRAEPMVIDALAATNPQRRAKGPLSKNLPERPRWSAVRVIASVSWAGGELTAQTVRLIKAE